MATLPGLRVGLTLDSATFIRETRRVQAELTGLNKSFAVAGTAVKALGAAFGGLIGGLSVTALAQAGKNALDMAGGLKELAQQAGVTTRELQILQFAGTQFGVSSEQISTSLAQFGIRLGKASGEGKGLSDTLRQYSISITDAQGKTRSSYEVLGDLAEAIQNAGSEQERLTIAAEAFGARVGAKMLPALIQGREGLDAIADTATRAGLILGDELVDEADRASDAISALQFAASKGFQVGVVEEFANAIGDSTEGLIAARDAGAEFGRIVGAVMREAVELAQALGPALSIVADTFNAMEQSGQGFTDSLRGLGILSEDLNSINRKLVELEETRREIVATSSKQGELERAAANTTILGIDEQIAALEQQKAELEDVAKQNDALNRSIGMGVKTIDQWTASLLGGAAAAHQAAAATKDTSREIEKLAALGMADMELAVSNAPVAEAKKEVEARSKAIDETARLRKAAAVDAAREAKQDAEKAKREAERRAEEALAPWIKNQQTLLEISEDFTSRAAQQRFKTEEDASREVARMQEKAADEQIRQQERQADLMLEPIRNAAQSIQSTLSDTFVEIFDGGLTSAQDFADALVDIMKRAAADIAAAMIMRPIMEGLTSPAGFAGLFGGGAAAGPTGFGPGLVPGGIMVPQFDSAGLTARGALGYGAAGGLGGFALGSSLFGGGIGSQVGGGVGGAGGAIGGALIGSMVPGIGTAVGGLAGGLLGGLGGGFLGSLFGGGSDGKQRSATIGGGPLGGTGSGLAGQFGAQIDQQLQQALTASQEGLVNAVLRTSQAIKLTFDKEKGLSEGDKQRIAASRIGPVATSLGINAAAVTQGSAEEQIGNLQTAIATMKQLEAFRLGGLGTQLRDINDTFQELAADANKYGLSLEGLAAAHQRAAEAAIRQRNAAFFTVAAQVGAIDPLGAALQQLNIQMQEAAASAVELGVPLQNIAAQHNKLAAALIRQSKTEFFTISGQVGATTPLQTALELLNIQMQEAAARAQELGVPLTNISAQHLELANALIAEAQAAQSATQAQNDAARRRDFFTVAEQVGAMTPLQTALELLNLQMQETAASARELGVPLKNVARAHLDAANALIRQQGQEKIRIAEAVGAASPLSAALASLNLTMQDNYDAARRLGIPLNNIAAEHLKLAKALIDEAEAARLATQAANDQALLAAFNPFEGMIDQLRQLGIELDRGVLNPLQQLEAAAQNFRDIANQASTGSVEAIQQFDDAARGFIQTAESVGASPGRVAAIQEVQAERQELVGQLRNAQAEAQRGFERAIQVASDREVDTLRELINEFRTLARRLA